MVGERVAEALREHRRRPLGCVGSHAQRKIPHWGDDTAGTEHAYVAGIWAEVVDAAACSRASALSRSTSGVGITQRRCSFAPTCVQ